MIKSNPRSFRLVCSLDNKNKVLSLLSSQGIIFEEEPFSPWCYKLIESPIPLGSSIAAYFGYIYIQDRSSMLPPLALPCENGDFVLDMCASPGGKTSFLAQKVGVNGFVLANEPSKNRFGTLRANINMMNLIHVGMCSYIGEKIPLLNNSCSRILLDPPCSGWGTSEKHPKVLTLWKGDKVDNLILLQRKLLEKASKLLCENGLLLYSTCTTNAQENEEQVLFAEKELGFTRINLSKFEGFTFVDFKGGEGCLRVDGEKSSSQGFFLALLKKSAPNEVNFNEEIEKSIFKFNNSKEKWSELSKKDLEYENFDISELLDCGYVRLYGQTVRFIPRLADILPETFIWQGAKLGVIGKNGFMPNNRLRSCLPKIEKNINKVVFDNTNDILQLLTGKKWQTSLKGKSAILFWQNLPLGRIGLKDGRVVLKF